jgi:hypothetical protein
MTTRVAGRPPRDTGTLAAAGVDGAIRGRSGRAED